MPAKSKSQQALAAMDLQRKKKGQKTATQMSFEELEHFAETPTKKLPTRVKKGK